MRNSKVEVEENENAYELDLAPMLALMVTLIPILLLTSVFLDIKVITSELPQVVQQAITQQQENPEEHASILLQISADKGFTLTTSYKNQVKKEEVPLNEDKTLNTEGLYKALLEVKNTHPQVFTLRLYPGSEISYDQIVQIIDTARQGKNGSQFQVRNAEGEEATTDLMFPDVVFANVLEG
jgi:biopolymer transport protein ExbD